MKKAERNDRGETVALVDVRVDEWQVGAVAEHDGTITYLHGKDGYRARQSFFPYSVFDVEVDALLQVRIVDHVDEEEIERVRRRLHSS